MMKNYKEMTVKELKLEIKELTSKGAEVVTGWYKFNKDELIKLATKMNESIKPVNNEIIKSKRKSKYDVDDTLYKVIVKNDDSVETKLFDGYRSAINFFCSNRRNLRSSFSTHGWHTSKSEDEEIHSNESLGLAVEFHVIKKG